MSIELSNLTLLILHSDDNASARLVLTSYGDYNLQLAVDKLRDDHLSCIFNRLEADGLIQVVDIPVYDLYDDSCG